MRLVEQPAQSRRAAEHGVDLLVVVGVVTVIRGRLENRREVECVHPEVDEVIEVLDDADQVTALIAMRCWCRPPLVEVVGLLDRQARAKRSGKIW